VADTWYYADGDGPKGPLSFRDLINMLSNVPDLRRILVWRRVAGSACEIPRVRFGHVPNMDVMRTLSVIGRTCLLPSSCPRSRIP
jgi:hypothetical protein